jgi:hypothetical protein
VIKPECPVHSTKMVPATRWIKLDGKPFPKPIHVCPTDGCLYVYDASHGYYKVPESEAIGNPLIDIPRSRFLGR